MPDPDVQIRGLGEEGEAVIQTLRKVGGGGGGGRSSKKVFPAGPQFGLKIRGGGRPPPGQAPPLDPPLKTR